MLLSQLSLLLGPLKHPYDGACDESFFKQQLMELLFYDDGDDASSRHMTCLLFLYLFHLLFRVTHPFLLICPLSLSFCFYLRFRALFLFL